ncbi:pleckstrin homology domain-containing family B member 2-like isoform X2 [Antedon mediterranea]|uniref:pleckstrin homology domain-containing family B member 2-like isoform X2 n=1 Tax=Antedon mediterranea TaxID=105859 RepID=UPI003AF96993
MATSAEAAHLHGIMKSGWMQRQSEFLRRWKRQYCVLYADGGFSYFTDESRNDSQGVINLPTRCSAINTGHEVRDVEPPADKTNSCLIQLKTTTGSVEFCADTPDDAQAWRSSLMEAKLANTRQGVSQTVPQLNPYNTYAPYGAPPPYSAQCPRRGGRVVQTTTTYPDGTQVVNVNGYPRQTRMYSYPGQTYYTTYQDPTMHGVTRNYHYYY